MSGYLIQLAPDVKPLTGPVGPTSDFTDLHAWAEAYLPGAGWIGLDATSGLMAGEGHIPLAASPDPMSAAPISGLMEPAETQFGFEMKVSRVNETPRVTKPYLDAQWQAILAAGAEVDRALEAGDVRLTMGGEPTFVSVDDPEGKEWTVDALGPTKRREAGRLMRRLLPLWGPGAALQYGAGKHYPGEQLPRWALNATWRLDGEPVWEDAALLADPDTATGDADAGTAHGFAQRLAAALGFDPAMVLPAYEDQPYFLMREARMPANVVAEAAQARDPLDRARIMRVFNQGLDAQVGSVLPLKRTGPPGARRRLGRGAPAAEQPAVGRSVGDRGGAGARSVRGAEPLADQGGDAGPAGGGRVRPGHPHGADGAGARRPAVCVPAAAHRSRGLARAGGGHRGGGRRGRAARGA